jgi:signal transduction histidine kinase
MDTRASIGDRGERRAGNRLEVEQELAERATKSRARAIIAHVRDFASRFAGSSVTRRIGRLSDFRLADRGGPTAAFLLVVAAFYLWSGASAALVVLVKLWAAFALAFLSLAALGKAKGVDAPWAAIVPTAVVGVALGGLGSAAIALAPDWASMTNWLLLGPEWAAGAAFSAFFIGLSLITTAVRRREARDSEVARQLLEARLKTLTAQIEPHFLMNTLANVRYLIKADATAARDMLDHLADFLNGALEHSRDVHSTLEREFRLVESYLAIMQIRFGGRLKFSIELPTDLRDVPFPPLLLHTLVENAVKHGLGPSGGCGFVRVAAERADSSVALIVEDNGVGIEHEIAIEGPLDAEAAPQFGGVGLQNTCERLATLYQGSASLTLRATAPSGTLARITIPEERI